MTSQDLAVPDALDRFIAEYLRLQTAQGLPCQVREADWPSDCFCEDSEEGALTPWRPVRISDPIDMFDRLGQALEQPIHPDLVSYYSRYWSDPLYARHPDGELSLLFCWNEADMERLRANLIGHALSKFRTGQPLTLFFACVEPDSDQILTLNNQDGSIWLERPGKPAIQQIAGSLSEFLEQLTPLPYLD